MAGKTTRYYLDFKLQFGDEADLLKVINSGKRLIPRLKGLISNRLANTKLAEAARLGMLKFANTNRVRGGPRMQSIYDNWAAARSDSKGRTTFFIFHKFLDKEKIFDWSNPQSSSGKVYKTPASLVINFLAYGRRGAYHIPKEIPTADDPVCLSWRYGRGSKPIFRNIPPQKRVFIRRKVTWGGGLFDWVNWQVKEYVDEIRDEIAAIIKSEGASPK